MKALLESAMVCEVNTVPNKEGKVFPKLVVVEQGQLYPEVKKLNIEGSDASKLSSLVGGVHDIQVEVQEVQGQKGKYTFYTFLGVSRKQAAA